MKLPRLVAYLPREFPSELGFSASCSTAELAVLAFQHLVALRNDLTCKLDALARASEVVILIVSHSLHNVVQDTGSSAWLDLASHL